MVKVVPTHITDSTTDKGPHKLFHFPMFFCIECDFKYEHCCHYKEHLTVHTDENPFQWHVCNFKVLTICKTYYMLNTILEFSHNSMIFHLISYCTKCVYKYEYCSHCKYHFKPHTEKKLFVYSVEILKLHSNSHSNYLEHLLLPLLSYMSCHTPIHLYSLIYFYKKCNLEMIFGNTYIRWRVIT